MFYNHVSGTPSWKWKPGKGYATAEQAETAARKLHVRCNADVDIVRLEDPKRPQIQEYVATVLTDALGRIWTQVSFEGGRFL